MEAHLAAAQRLGRRLEEGYALNNLGNAYRNLGEVQKAIDYYEQDLAIAGEVRDRRGEASTNRNLSLAYEQQGDLARAVALMQACVDYKREVGHPDADKDAARLAKLQQQLADGAAPEAT